MTTNMPADKHWLQLVHTNFYAFPYTAANTWADPNGSGFWLIDNGAVAGQPFYDIGFPIKPPIFNDGADGPWDGTSYFHAYLFVAEMDASNKITLHDEVYWGFDEPVVVPEPWSLGLLGVGGLAALCWGRRAKLAI
jgi:hypothetical protein